MVTRPSRPLLILAVGGTLVAGLAVASLLLRGRGADVLYGLWVFQNAPSGVLLLWLGTFVLTRNHAHAAGRLLMASGTIQVSHVLVAAYADLRLVAAGLTVPLVGDHGVVPAQLPVDAAVALLVMNVLWVPAVLLLIALPLVFPDGRLLGRGWRWVILVDAAAIVLLSVGSAIDAWPTRASTEPPPPVSALLAAGGVGALVTAGAGVTAFVVRWSRAARSARRYVLVGGLALLCSVVTIATYPWPAVWTVTVHVVWNLFLVGYALAAVRFRLHDLDPLLGKRNLPEAAALLSVMALAAVMASLVVPAASTGAAALAVIMILVGVVLAVPLHAVVRAGVARTLFGAGIADDAVIAQIARHAQRGEATDDVVRESVHLVLRGTGADRVEFRPAAGTAVVAGTDPVLAPSDVVLDMPVGHGPEHFGSLIVAAGALVDLPPRTQAFVEDVARILALALRAERLNARVEDQLVELEASRNRLVHAQQDERHRIERDLHDGAQAQLIALRLRIETARATCSDEPTRHTLLELARAVDGVVRELRALASGVLPHELDSGGVVPALRAGVRGLRLPVQIRATRAARYPPAVEGAIYFTCLEAIQNSLRHSSAANVVVTLDCGAERVEAAVRDDGRGFDPATVILSGLLGVEDRVRALGGSFAVVSEPGGGTTVRAVVEAQERSSAR